MARHVAMDALNELGFYTLAGYSDSPRRPDRRGAHAAERAGIGAASSERFDLKDAATLSAPRAP